MAGVKLMAALFSFFGLLELFSWRSFGESSISLMREFFIDFNHKFKHHLHGGTAMAQDDETRHRAWWGYKDEEHEDDHVAHFHEVMQKKMMDVKRCHNGGKSMGGNSASPEWHQKCPKPWKHFQDKCEKLKPAWACHKECWGKHLGHDCHSKCPLPECPKLTAEIQISERCHQKCGKGDPMCHHGCPRPMTYITRKCDALLQAVHCHDKCKPGARACHHGCPKMWTLWHLGAHHDSSAEEDTTLHQRWWLRDETHPGELHNRFHELMQKKMVEVKTCHQGCHKDGSCHGKCVKPWQAFKEKCEELKPVWMCHHDCWQNHGGHACHAKCPMPACPHLASRFREFLQCHQRCGKGDHFCHSSCPRPLALIRPKCEALAQVIGCHDKCKPGEVSCNHVCPKMWRLWHLHDASADVDEVQHRQWWNYLDDSHHGDHRSNFNMVMRDSMMGVKICHKTCDNGNRDPFYKNACHKACPRPWKSFNENCEQLQPVLTCHKECWHNTYIGQACHAKCPLPENNDLAEKLEDAVECRGKCGKYDHACHRSCPHPMAHIGQKCEQLQQVTQCHQKCPVGDHGCHHICPKMRTVWHLTNHHRRHTHFLKAAHIV